MNLKKIIREESTGFEWTDEIDSGINLEPNTMYFFQPKADIRLLRNFAKYINNAPYIKELLENRVKPLTYFVTEKEDPNVLAGWCSNTDPYQGKVEVYNDNVNMVDVRNQYGEIL